MADGLYELAIDEVDALIAADPGSAAAVEGVYLKARSLRELGKSPNAEFRRYIVLAPEGPHADECLYGIGVAAAAAGRDEAAVDTLTLLIEDHPESSFRPHALMRRARLTMAGNPSGAMRDLSQVITDYPDDPLAAYARHDLAVLYLDSGDAQRALDTLQPLTDESLPEVLREPIREVRARANLRLGHYQAVVDQLSGSTTPTAQRLLGEAFLAQERYDEAIPSLRIAAAEDGSDSDAAYSLGWCLFQIGKSAEAEDVWARFADSEGPLKSAALLGAADAAREQGAKERCEHYCEEVRAEAEGDELARSLLCLGLIEEDTDSALALLEQAFATSGATGRTQESAKMAAGGILLRRGEAGAAAEAYRSAIQVARTHDLDSAEAEYGYALALLQAGRADEAAQIVTERASGRREALLAAEAHLAARNWSAAEADYRRILQLDAEQDADDRVEALFGIGWCRLSAEDAAGALEWFDRAAVAAPESKRGREALLRLGDAATLAGQDETAVELYGLYLQRDPQGEFAYDAQLGRAQALLRLGRRAEAAAAARAARQWAAGDGDAVAEAFLVEARSLFEGEEFAAAESLYLQAADAANAPALAEEAVYRLGDCRFNLHDNLGAANAYALTIRTFPSGKYLAQAVQGLYWAAGASHGKVDADSLMASLLADAGPAAGRIELQRALVYRDRGDTDEARSELGRIARDHAGTPEAADALYFVGSMEENPSNAAWRTLVREYPSHPNASRVRRALIEAALVEGNPKEAAEWAAPLTDDAAEDRLLKGLIQSELGDFESARSILTPLAAVVDSAVSPEDRVTGWRARVALATVADAQGDSAQAAGLLEEVVAQAPPAVAAEALYRQGEMAYHHGQIAAALRTFLKVRYLYPEIRRWCHLGELAAGSCYESQGDRDQARMLYQKLMEEEGVADAIREKAAARLRELGE